MIACNNEDVSVVRRLCQESEEYFGCGCVSWKYLPLNKY